MNPDVEISPSAIKTLADGLGEYSSLGAIAPALINPDSSVQHGFSVRNFPTISATLAELFYLHKLWPKNPWTLDYQRSDDSFLKNYLEQKPAGKDLPHEAHDLPLLVEQPAAACLLIRREAFDELGGFEMSYYPAWFEDVDFCKRLEKSGYQIAVDSRARVVHEGGYSLSALGKPRFVRAWYPNMLRYWDRHGSAGQYFAIRGLLPIALLIRSAVAAVTGMISSNKLENLELARTLLGLAICPNPTLNADPLPPTPAAEGPGNVPQKTANVLRSRNL
jgi:GT2 family glycosyltransferase